MPGESHGGARIWSKTPMDPLTPSLFVREDGSSMSFYVRPARQSTGSRRSSCRARHSVSRSGAPGAVLLAQPRETRRRRPQGDFISTQYILDCVGCWLPSWRPTVWAPAPVAGQAPEAKPAVQAEDAAAAAVAEPEPSPAGADGPLRTADNVAILTYVKEHARSASSVTR